MCLDIFLLLTVSEQSADIAVFWGVEKSVNHWYKIELILSLVAQNVCTISINFEYHLDHNVFRLYCTHQLKLQQLRVAVRCVPT
jgi:hypothetical protein